VIVMLVIRVLLQLTCVIAEQVESCGSSSRRIGVKVSVVGYQRVGTGVRENRFEDISTVDRRLS